MYVKVSCIACTWHVLVMYPINLHVAVHAWTTIATIVLMYQESSVCVQ